MKDYITKDIGLSMRIKCFEIRVIDHIPTECVVIEYFYRDKEAQKRELSLAPNDMYNFTRTFKIEI